MLSRPLLRRLLVPRLLLSGVAAVAFWLAAALPAAAVPAAAVPAAVGGPATTAVAGTAGVAAAGDSVRSRQQWVLTMLNAETAWPVSQGASVTVAVIDSGVDPDVSDLTGSVTTGRDFTGLTTSPSDPHWGEHGTWMASIIAGHGHDGGADGIIGVAPQAKILSIRVIPDMSDPGYATYDNEPEQRIQRELADGIDEAIRAHVQVISMSIGYSEPSGVVRAALQRAYDQGIVLVASSGNSGNSDERHDHGLAPVSFPAEYPGVLSVGAVTINRQPASFSSGNLSVRIAAPGKAVPAEGRDGLYFTVDGTSPACALAAGVAALIKSKYPGISPARVIQALTSTAQPEPLGSGYNFRTGFGIVDASAALAAAGRLLAQRPAGSQVALSSHFGGGAAAVPAAPVAPRSVGRLALFAALALLAVAVAAAGLVVVLRRRRHPLPAPAPAPAPGLGPRPGPWSG